MKLQWPMENTASRVNTGNRWDRGEISMFEEIGMIIDIARNHPRFENVSIEQYLPHVMSGIRANRRKMVFDMSGVACAYASWVYLDKSTHYKVLTGYFKGVVSHDEFNHAYSENRHLWFLDFLCTDSSRKYVVSQLRELHPMMLEAYLLQTIYKKNDKYFYRLWG